MPAVGLLFPGFEVFRDRNNRILTITSNNLWCYKILLDSPDQQGKSWLFRTNDEHFVWLSLTLEEIVSTDAKFLFNNICIFIHWLMCCKKKIRFLETFSHVSIVLLTSHFSVQNLSFSLSFPHLFLHFLSQITSTLPKHSCTHVTALPKFFQRLLITYK